MRYAIRRTAVFSRHRRRFSPSSDFSTDISLERRLFASIFTLRNNPLNGQPSGKLVGRAQSTTDDIEDLGTGTSQSPISDSVQLQNPFPGDGGIVVESSITNAAVYIFTDTFTSEVSTLVDISGSTIAETQLYGDTLTTIQAVTSHYHSDHFSVIVPGDYDLGKFAQGWTDRGQNTGLGAPQVWYQASNPGQVANVTFSVTVSGKEDRFIRLATLHLSSSLINVQINTYAGSLSITDNSTGSILYEDSSFGQGSTADSLTFSTNYNLPENVFLDYSSTFDSGPDTFITTADGIIQESAISSFDWSFAISTS